MPQCGSDPANQLAAVAASARAHASFGPRPRASGAQCACAELPQGVAGREAGRGRRPWVRAGTRGAGGAPRY
jgi:hypothetical protein